VRAQVAARAFEALQVAMSHWYFTRRDLQPWIEDLEACTETDGLAQALRVERCVALDAFGAIIERGERPLSPLPWSSRVFPGLVKRDAAWCVDALGRLAEEARRGPAGAAAFGATAGAVPWYSSTGRPFVERAKRLMDTWHETRAHEGLMLSALHLRLHQHVHGMYPAALSDLQAKVPHDPYTGEPLLYRREGAAGFTLYSVGPDRKDDGGKTPADLVFRVWK
jgi:hypothetical protein